MRELFFGQGTGHSIMLLALVIAIGLLLGKIKVKGVSLGSTWILFVGILLSHFGFRADASLLHFLKEFGLILFVFSIGLQVGPGFFHSFKSGGLKLNMLAVALVLTGVITTYLIHVITGENLITLTGVMSGAVTREQEQSKRQFIPNLYTVEFRTPEEGICAADPQYTLSVAFPLHISHRGRRVHTESLRFLGNNP